MQLFYAPDLPDGDSLLPEVEARHCVGVLRKKSGDVIHITDGKGSFYEAVLTEVSNKKCVVEVKAVSRQKPETARLHLLVAPPKNTARLEWLLEKATEIGMEEMTPVFTQRSERSKLRTERLQKVLVAAMKQSQRAWLPQLNEPVPLARWWDAGAYGNYTNKVIAHIHPESRPLHSLLGKGGSCVALVGPEGGFAGEEFAVAQQHGFSAASLGRYRLRTETAGLVVCHTHRLVNAGF